LTAEASEGHVEMRYRLYNSHSSLTTTQVLKQSCKISCALHVPEARETLRNTTFGGRAIKVTLEDIYVGTTITTRRGPRQAKLNQRILDGIQISNAASRTTVESELKKRAHMMAAIPKILHGLLWTFPSARSTSTMRTAAVKCVGQFDNMRSPETVIAVLNNPVRADPIAAICYRGICDTRRPLERSQERYSGFLMNRSLAIDSNMPNIQGLEHGLICLFEHCGATCTIVIHRDSGQTANLTLGSNAAFRRQIDNIATRHILTALANRVNGTSKKHTARKDMIWIIAAIDRNATFSVRKPTVYAHNAKYSSDYLKRQPDDSTTLLNSLWHRYLATTIAGTTRFGDRLLAGRLWATD